MIGDPCTCESIDVSLAQRCAHCRFEACDMFTYSVAPDAEYFDSVGEILTLFREIRPDLHEVVIFGYLKKRLDPKLYDRLPKAALEHLLEELDEEYGAPEEYYTPCPNMKQAAQDFVELVLDHYEVWQCEPKPLASKIFKTRRAP